jgi:alkanesulfonate monooxygenase SsuD/methylene tetrahydromethanopterin reductase-like flavin-dependent oxidoreductase (luciferase family)
MAGVNVIAADSDDDAERQFHEVLRHRIARFLAPGRNLSEVELDHIVESPQGRQVAQMMHYSAVGTGDVVGRYVREFANVAQVDEVITAHASPTIEERLRSVDLLADANDSASVSV